MVRDSKAEELEARGLYRRAAERWAEVMMLVDDDRAREQAAKRRTECIHKAMHPPARPVSFTGIREAADRTQARMGLDRPNGGAFRNYPKVDK
ncbi:PerC family transcriptional regulator [Salmonella enterica subsp. enterica serovar Glostrup]|nr:PerC family transcriptional regulator [Salmonella enterica subsp. enterica serovar Glostrup]